MDVKYHFDEKQFKLTVQASQSMGHLLELLGVIKAGGNYTTMRQRIQEFNIDVSHWEKMKRKIISIVLIFLITIMITVDLYKQQAVAVAPAVLLIPAATYAIYTGLAAAGVIGNTNTDHEYIAQKFIDNITDYEKAQWNASTRYCSSFEDYFNKR